MTRRDYIPPKLVGKGKNKRLVGQDPDPQEPPLGGQDHIPGTTAVAEDPLEPVVEDEEVDDDSKGGNPNSEEANSDEEEDSDEELEDTNEDE